MRPVSARSPHIPVELRHLRYFIAVADELHFGRAAERLGISQPPLSQQIRQLERSISVQLLVRSSRRVELTAAGRVFLAEACALLAQADRAVELAQRAARGEAGELRVGFTASIPLTSKIPRTVVAFRTQRPEVHLQLEEMPSLQQIDAIMDKRLDIGIIRPAPLPPTLRAQTLFSDPLVAVMRRDHPLLGSLPRGGCLQFKQLADGPFVVFSRGAGTGIHDQIVALCLGAGFSPRISQEAVEPSTIIGLVSAGLGVSLLPASYEHIRVEGVVYVPQQDPGAASEIRLVHRGDERSPLVAQFARLLIAEANGPATP